MHSCLTWSDTVKQQHDRSQSQVPLMLVHRYVDENGLAANRPAGVAPEVNLRIPLCTGNIARKWGGSTLALKQVSVTPKKETFLMCPGSFSMRRCTQDCCAKSTCKIVVVVPTYNEFGYNEQIFASKSLLVMLKNSVATSNCLLSKLPWTVSSASFYAL